MTTTSSADILCAGIAQRLIQDIGQRRYDMWFDRSALFDYDEHDHRLEVIVPNRFVADWINKHFQQNLQTAAVAQAGHDVSVQVSVQIDKFNHQQQSQQDRNVYAAPTARGVQSASDSGDSHGQHSSTGEGDAASKPEIRIADDLAQRARRHAEAKALHHNNSQSQGHQRTLRASFRHQLDNFIVGPSNELSYAAASRISDLEHHDHTPLFIHGGCGLGKTHLLQGICRRVLEKHPDARVMYFTGEAFTNEFLAAVRANNVASFRNKIRGLDLLAVDDIHFLANKQATQQEFLHCFDAIDLGGARLVLASDNHPKLIRQFSQALVSRCMRGLVVEVRSPDVVTRARLIRAIAKRRHIDLMDSVVDTLANRCSGSVREIEGALTKLQALASLGGKFTGNNVATGSSSDVTITQPGHDIANGTSGGGIGHVLVNQLFAAELSHAPRHAVRFDTILEVVSRELGINTAQITGSGRKQMVVLARSLVVHLARQLTNMSYPEIAAAMGKAAHSTMITADQRIVSQMTASKAIIVPGSMHEMTLAELVEKLKQAIQRG